MIGSRAGNEVRCMKENCDSQSKLCSKIRKRTVDFGRRFGRRSKLVVAEMSFWLKDAALS